MIKAGDCIDLMVEVLDGVHPDDEPDIEKRRKKIAARIIGNMARPTAAQVNAEPNKDMIGFSGSSYA